MKIGPFETEHFFARYEFTTPYQLCNSDCETLTVKELLEMADVTMDEFGHLSLGYTESLGHPKLRDRRNVCRSQHGGCGHVRDPGRGHLSGSQGSPRFE